MSRCALPAAFLLQVSKSVFHGHALVPVSSFGDLSLEPWFRVCLESCGERVGWLAHRHKHTLYSVICAASKQVVTPESQVARVQLEPDRTPALIAILAT